MEPKAISAVISALLVASSVALKIDFGTAQSSGTSLFVEPEETIVGVLVTFTININVENAVDLFSYETKLVFNKTILEPNAIEEGPFIQDQTTSPSGTFFLSIMEENYVQIACVTQGNYPGVSGSGTLFNVTFTTLRSGTSDLHLHDSILLDSTVTEISHDTVDGSVLTILFGDVNDDGMVNVVDLTLVSMSYGAFEGEPDYNPDADLNDDGIIDMKDLFVVARNLGKH